MLPDLKLANLAWPGDFTCCFPHLPVVKNSYSKSQTDPSTQTVNIGVLLTPIDFDLLGFHCLCCYDSKDSLGSLAVLVVVKEVHAIWGICRQTVRIMSREAAI